MLRSDAEREAFGRQIEAKRVASWAALLKELRAANPAQKIEYNRAKCGSPMYVREILIDGTGVEVRLDQEGVGHFGRNPGRFYFTIGAWHRARRARPRVIDGKKGFDWVRICSLMEVERLRVARDLEHAAEQKATQKAAESELKAMFKRRPELRAVKDLIEIENGKFTVTMRRVKLQYAEVALGVALNEQQRNEKEVDDV